MVSAAPQKVQVFSLGRPRPGVDRDRRRYYVKWRVDGRDRTRSFKTRGEAERFRSELQTSVREGQPFDLALGLPVAWVEQSGAPTWWSWSAEWLCLKWPQWSGHSRRSGVESLTLLAPLLVRPNAPPPPVALAAWLRELGYQPGPAPPGDMASWLDRWSIPLADIEPALLEGVLQAASTRADGAATVVAVARRRRIEWRPPAHSVAVDVATVATPTDVAAIIDHVAAMSGGAGRYAALFAMVGVGGVGPSEAIGLHVADLELPARGWGLASLRGAITSPGTRYTTAGTVVETKSLKHRAPGAVREVPISPGLVAHLQRHLERFEPVEGRVFSNAKGQPVTATNYGPVWVRARSTLWPAGHSLAATTLYDLRHAAATMMLRAAVPPAEVARRLGHSVDMLMRVYAGVFADERDRSNQLIDDALLGKGRGRGKRKGSRPVSGATRGYE